MKCNKVMMKTGKTDTHVNIMSLSFNSIKSTIITKSETSSRHKRAKMKNKVDTVSDVNLMPIGIFKVLFLKATMEQLGKHKDKRVILCTYSKTK